MAIFHHHPDGIITIGDLTYALSQFLLDEPGYKLPAGMIGRFYNSDTGQHYLTDGLNQYGALSPWPDGEHYLANEAAYQAAYQARINAPVSLDDYKKSQSIKIQNACKEQIFNGFQSSALGSVYTYPANDRDQVNLNGAVTQSYYAGNPGDWTISFYCADTSGAWLKRPHTAAQIQQVGADAINAIQTALNKNDALQQMIQSAATIEAVTAIEW